MNLESEDPFVGRRGERKALIASLRAARSGRGRLEILSGPAGIGKTRLTLEIAAAAEELGMRVLRGGCWEGQGAPAYWPWTAALRGALGDADAATVIATDLDAILQVAASLAGLEWALDGDTSRDPEQARFALFDRCAAYLAATAAAQPTLLILDDVHWADADSLLLLQFVAGRTGGLPLALVVTSREPIPDVVAAASRHSWARHMPLGGLSRAEASSFLGSRLARAPGSRLLDRLMQLSEGNPFFLKELGQLLLDEEDNDLASLDLRLPASLVVVALQPYLRLTPASQRALRAAAVIGDEFDADLAAMAVGLSAREILALLDEAIERQAILAAGRARYRFAHALLREAILNQIPAVDRAQYHQEILAALERRLETGQRVPPAALAHHAFLGLPLTDPNRAAAHAVAAGEDAYRACAYEDAVLHFRRAREAAGQTLSDSDSCDLLLRLGAAEAGAGAWTHSRATFAQAAALARTLKSPDRLARAALGFKGMMLATFPVDTSAIALLQEAAQSVDETSPHLLVELNSALSTSLYFDDPLECDNYSRRALTLAKRTGSDHLLATALLAHLLAGMRPESQNRTIHEADELLSLASRLREPRTAFHARMFRYAHFLSAGQRQDAARELRHLRDLPSASHTPRSLWKISLFRASDAIVAGNAPRAQQLLQRALEFGRRLHDPSAFKHSRLQALQLSRFTKDYALLSTDVAEAVEQYAHTPAYIAAVALIQADCGLHDQAKATIYSLAATRFSNIPPDFFSLFILCIVADAVAKSRQPEWARILYDLLLPHQHLFVVAAYGTIFDGSVHHYLAILASTFGDFNSAIRHYEAALRAHVLLSSPPLLARTHLEYARALGNSPSPVHTASSRAHATLARDSFTRLNLSALAREAEELTTSARPSTPLAPAPSPPATDNTLLRAGDFWLLRFDAHEVLLRHRVGLTYIASLLHAKGAKVHVLDLAARGEPGPSPGRPDLLAPDAKAREAYKKHLTELTAELAVATEHNDLARIESLQYQRDALLAELSYSFGLSGQPRPLKSPTERARVSVKNRITAALRIIEAQHKQAFKHLSLSIRTGTYCSYIPDTDISWACEPDTLPDD